MQNITGVRVVSAAALVAAIVFGARGLVGTIWLAPWDLPRGVLLVGTVLAGLAGVLVLVAASRARDRRALAFGASAVAFALLWPAPGWATEVLLVVAQGALIAFGVLTIRGDQGGQRGQGGRGGQRTLGWIVTVAASLWFVTALLSSTALILTIPETALGVVLSVPGLLQAVAYLAAAVLVAVPLLRTVGQGAGALWASAEVR
ncbi:hypothetical protein [Curtobacterium sp. PhB115]|uniref:hypothetical protein n=1 Tax=Curtobacterium sp. PhB115 TaxID=2485173 RepID=UPI000F4B1201|nr:hypothetical protein [Curtobacterium sp. PhB115]ROP74225.1 hypothetical protein EDF19_0304 [Curtobacterium sp. PhB115]